jgi:hypothetical protein
MAQDKFMVQVMKIDSKSIANNPDPERLNFLWNNAAKKEIQA